eukprot:TRINITY_DN8958_c0_g1_i1.p1 TRINITY_DN8958_c0_g1~~TRINITY_DN8958_c0_g1_i1.p1  ORF type:complete len:659 (+),score=60.69 TRINITY_DN8958_c0_g1_i1:1-1977(+)
MELGLLFVFILPPTYQESVESRSSTMVVPSKEDLDYLDEHTHLTRRDITAYYADSGRTELDREAFDQVLDNAGIFVGEGSSMIRDRFYDEIDINNDGMVSMREIVVMLATLERGTLKDLARLFFRIFDVNDNQKLERQEIIDVYTALLSATTKSQMTQEQRNKVDELIQEADSSRDGKLDFNEFYTLLKKNERPKEPITFQGALETIFLVIVTSFFEMGASFAFPAVGALSIRMKERLDVGDAEIGTATGIYYVGAIIGPILFGTLMDRLNSPIIVVILANSAVALGALLQAVASEIWLLYIARIIMGFGGDSAPFGTVETLQRLFPNQFLLMAGIRNFVQSGSGAVAFFILPVVADEFGTVGALWFCFFMSVLALASNMVILIYMQIKRKSQQVRPKKSVAQTIRAYARAITPKPPTPTSQFFKLPLSFIPAIFAIQSFYYPPFSFTAFTVDMFTTRFQKSESMASFLSGSISLISGICGPFFGPLSDFMGNRALVMALWMIPCTVAFMLFALTTSVSPWVGITLLGMTYGWGDTVSYSSIRLLVGPERAGLGYGIFGSVSSVLAFLVPVIGGEIYQGNNGKVNVNWFFAALSIFGGVCWLAVRLMEGSNSAMELPANKLIETEDVDINIACMYSILGAGKVQADDENPKGNSSKFA